MEIRISSMAYNCRENEFYNSYKDKVIINKTDIQLNGRNKRKLIIRRWRLIIIGFS